MDLIRAATTFDSLALIDDVTGMLLGRCQLDLYDDSKREGLSASRRIVSMSPDVAALVPPHGKVRIEGELWLLASPHHDYWFSRRIRTKYVAMAMSQRLTVTTAANLLSGQPGKEIPCNVVWTKNDRREAVGDGSLPIYTIYVSPEDTPDPAEYVVMGTDYFRVRAAYISPSGAHAAELIPLPYGGVKTVTYKARATHFDAVQGAHVGAAPAAKPALVSDWFDVYSIQAVGQEGKRGDLSISMLPAAQETGDVIDVDGQAYRVIFVQEVKGVALLRARI